MSPDALRALARHYGARVHEVPYDGITFTLGQLMRFAADPAHRAEPTPIGRAPDHPRDLVPLTNGRSVDLGGKWKLPA